MKQNDIILLLSNQEKAISELDCYKALIDKIIGQFTSKPILAGQIKWLIKTLMLNNLQYFLLEYYKIKMKHTGH